MRRAAERRADRRPRWTAAGVVVAALVAAAACGGGNRDLERTAGDAEPPEAPSTTVTTAATAPASSTSTAATTPVEEARVVEVRYRIERRTADDATADFVDVVRATLADQRGWQRAGFRLVEDPSAPYTVVLAEPDEVDRLCHPYDTGGRWSCQNGPVVAMNADRWRHGSDKWTGDLATYRQMLVNHEVGHLLGQHHPPSPQCPEAGQPAPVMAQQSTELDGCLPNPWPLEWEIALAARHEEPLAPPYEED